MKKIDPKRFQAAMNCIAWLTILLFATPAMAQTLSLMAPGIANDNETLTASFGVTVEDKPILKGELEDGINMILRCTVDLIKPHDYWPDTTIATVSLQSSLRFDQLTREYILVPPGSSTPMRDTDFVAILEKGWGQIKTELGPWSLLEKGQRYAIRMVTSINEADAPDGLLKFFYFWSWDAGADNTFQLNFIY